MKQSERIDIFVHEIWKWFSVHKRELPWRDLQIEDDTQRAYQILVSEIMLQQTQVSRVKLQYKNFLEQFPTIRDLASATNADVVMAWRGMGYNSRALRLRDAAKEVKNRKWKVENDEWNMKNLQALSGVGHYTAAAIRNFAFNIPTPCLDVNIQRILHRTFYGPEDENGKWKTESGKLLALADKVLTAALQPSLSTFNFPLSSSNWHAALMDFGSLVCTKRNPKWDVCPLTKAGIMKAAYKVKNAEIKMKNEKKKEPGRYVAGKYIPNRIFRGKIIEELRDNPSGLSFTEIGRRVCIDWDEAEHSTWIETLIVALKKDHLVSVEAKKVQLQK